MDLCYIQFAQFIPVLLCALSFRRRICPIKIKQCKLIQIQNRKKESTCAVHRSLSSPVWASQNTFFSASFERGVPVGGKISLLSALSAQSCHQKILPVPHTWPKPNLSCWSLKQMHRHTNLYLSTHINYMGITETWFRDVTNRV